MILIVGLGNPGKKYANTRHNLGFMVVDTLWRKLTPVKKTVWKEDKRFKSLIAKVDDLILAKPQTMMNASGFAVKKLWGWVVGCGSGSDGGAYSRLWVVHDDLDLHLGKMKIRLGGAAAGHHGVESIIEQLGTDQFVRFRLGIGHPHAGRRMEGGKKITKFDSQEETEDFVLAPFSPTEKDEVRRMIKKAIEAIEFALEKGLEKAMNRFN